MDKFTHFLLHKAWTKQQMRQDLFVFKAIFKQNFFAGSCKFSISYSTVNLSGVSWKICKLEIFIIQLIKYKL